MLFVCHSKMFHKHCFQFLLGVKMAPRETENNAYAKFGETNKEHYSMLWYFLERSISRPGLVSYRKSLLISHSVMEMCFSCFMNTKYNCLRCDLPICNKCSVFKKTRTLRDEQPVKELHNASLPFLFLAIS